MTHPCPGCGFVSGAEARYCRMCGTPLPPRAGSLTRGADDSVSPNADTVPLGGAHRPTEDISSAHITDSPIASPTSGVARDFEEFRRRAEEANALLDGTETAAADQARPTGELAPFARQTGGEVTIHVRPVDPALQTPAGAPRADGARDGFAPPPAGVTAAAGAGRAGEARRGGGNVENRVLRLWAGLAIFGVVVMLCVAAAVFVGWYALRGGRAERDAAAGVESSVPLAAPTAPAADAKQQAADKLAEAEQLLAAGRADEAVARLRESAALDPSNAEPHRRLARLLLDGGSRRTAIEELRAVLRAEPNDAPAWRELAAAQAAEGLHRDAADSYRRLFEVSDEARRDDRLRLAHAATLLRAGRESEARAAYERLASSRVADVARESRKQLARLEREDKEEAAAESRAESAAAASPSPAAMRDASASERESERASAESASRAAGATNSDAGRAAVPSEQLSPRERYERGVRLWPSNRSAAVSDFAAAAQAGNSDANYYLGLNLVEGRAVGALRRGELVAALNYFQRARRGRHATEARRREEELGREYDRRRAAGDNR